MRPIALAALVLAASLAPTPSAAEGPTLTDPEGDQQWVLGPAAVPVGMPVWKGGDFRSLSITEAKDTLTFDLQVTALDQQPAQSNSFVAFNTGEVTYFVRYVYQALPGQEPSSFSALGTVSDKGVPRRVAFLEHAFDPATGLMRAIVPRAYLADEDGRIPLMGDELTDIFAQTLLIIPLPDGSRLETRDVMPDTGSGSFPITLGGEVSGHLRLFALDPVRVSNGEAGTFIYHLRAENHGDAPDEVAITTQDIPEGWEVRVEPLVQLKPGEAKEFVALVSIPFTHEHGEYASLKLTATSARDASARATSELGILHTPIPQPTGHHSELYLHPIEPFTGPLSSVQPFYAPLMTTESGHEEDMPYASPNYQEQGFSGWAWRVALDPSLQMGLDFDIERVGELTLGILGSAPGSGTVEIRVELERPGESPLQLVEPASAPVTLDHQTPSVATFQLVPTPESDYIAYKAGQNIQVIVLLTPDPTTLFPKPPVLTTLDYKLTLPLNEYSDPVVSAEEAPGALTLVVEGAAERAGVRGASLVYPLTLTNRGEAEDTVRLELAGTDAQRAELIPAGEHRLAPGQVLPLTLGVTLPAGGNDGESLEVLVVARSQTDPTVTAIARTRSTIADAGGADDTLVLAAARDASRDSPGAGLALVALALVGALLVRRRR